MSFANTRRQGDAGVGATVAYYTSIGYPVSLPFGEGQRYDLIVDVLEGLSGTTLGLKRVQCKTTLFRNKSGTYEAELRTKGGNRSGTGKLGFIQAHEIELVTILDGDGGLWIFPSEELAGKASIALGNRVRHRLVLH